MLGVCACTACDSADLAHLVPRSEPAAVDRLHTGHNDALIRGAHNRQRQSKLKGTGGGALCD
jgi:hypothetical protein